MRIYLLIAPLITTLVAAVPVTAWAKAGLPADREASILVRALAYDRNLKARAGSSYTVGVVYRVGDSRSKSSAKEIYEAFSKLDKYQVQGLKLDVLLFAYGSSLQSTIKEHNIDALYVSPALDDSITSIRNVTRSAKVISMAGNEAGIGRGLSLAIVLANNRPKILLNLKASKSEGADFSSKLIRLARIVE